MNIIIYTLVFLGIIYFLLKLVANTSSKKISKHLRKLIFLGLIILAVLFVVAGKFLLSIPLTLLSLALVKLKGFSIFQLIGLFRLIQTLRNSGRFSFNQNQNIKNSSKISIEEAYKILNLDIKKNISKDDVFYDLGSGIGNVCFKISYSTNAKSIGYELVKKRHDVAIDINKEFSLLKNMENKVELFNEDFTKFAF